MNILVVDDWPDVAEMVALMLRLLGHHVKVAFNGGQALDLIAQNHPDVVLLDLDLPGMDGFEVAEAAVARFGKCTRFVALTGRSGGDDRLRAAEAGIEKFLVKPPSLAQLKAALA